MIKVANFLILLAVLFFVLAGTVRRLSVPPTDWHLAAEPGVHLTTGHSVAVGRETDDQVYMAEWLTLGSSDNTALGYQALGEIGGSDNTVIDRAVMGPTLPGQR